MGGTVGKMAGSLGEFGGLLGGLGGDTFGKRDTSATNDVKDGKVVATGTPGATTVADPNQGLTGGQLAARKLFAGVGQGLQGASGQQQPRAGQASPIQVTQAPDVSGFYPVKPIMPATNPNDPYSAFYRR